MARPAPGHNDDDIKSDVVTAKSRELSAKCLRRAGDPAVLFADARKIHRELGWSARHVEIDQIVATAWNWHKDHADGYGE